LKYEHLIQVNDPNDPAVISLTRSQLWRGLLMRVENPGEFVYGLDAMRIRARGDGFIERTLYFGARAINDRVNLVENESVRYSIEPGPEFPDSHMSMHIEEPLPEHLFLRFSYETSTPDGAEFEDFVKQAYFEADLDTVSRIRMLAARGSLD
jgi:hypothetical protein